MNKFKRVLSIEGLVEAILFVFAIANYSTISEYFIASNMNTITSHAVGILMGLILIASALMLSRVEQTSKEFKFILISTCLAAALAAILQSLAYHEITKDWVTSIIKGAGFPIVEVLLAYSVSLFTSYLRHKELENADAAFDEQLAQLQREVMRNIDPEKLRESVETKMHRVVDARIDKFVSDQLAKYHVDAIHIPAHAQSNSATVQNDDAMQINTHAKPVQDQDAMQDAYSEDAPVEQPFAYAHVNGTSAYTNGAIKDTMQIDAIATELLDKWNEEQLAYFATEQNYATDKERAIAMHKSGLFNRKDIAMHFGKDASTISRWLSK